MNHTHEELRPTWSPNDILHVHLTVEEVLPVDPSSESSDVDETPAVSIIIDINRYSTLSKLLCVITYVLRFTKCVKSHESISPQDHSQLL